MTLPRQADHVVVGAGAAGIVTAKLLGLTVGAHRVVLIERHAEPGGSAGYFSRGFPRRSFDAGATQLIECGPGGLQHVIFHLAESEPRPDAFIPIPFITHHWLSEDGGIRASARVHADGSVSGDLPEKDARALALFLRKAQKDADWMWALLQGIPRFPLQSSSDLWRALTLFLSIPLRHKLRLPLLLFRSLSALCRQCGLDDTTPWAADVVDGLLLDTVQTNRKQTPWLAGVMGVSILQRGIYRVKGGMRGFFRPLLSDARSLGVVYRPAHEVTRLETTDEGFVLTVDNLRLRTTERITVSESISLNLTIWDVLRIVPREDTLRETSVFRRWERRAQQESAWGAFALYATLKAPEGAPDEPWYHQIFPAKDDAERGGPGVPVYVSISGAHDPANPPGGRVLTATAHVPAGDLAPERRVLLAHHMTERIERVLGTRLEHRETATPATFERFTGRSQGRVGGFITHARNFLFLANPSVVRHPRTGAALCLIGDSAFPGQGVISCGVSGIIAWERITGRRFNAEPWVSRCTSSRVPHPASS